MKDLLYHPMFGILLSLIAFEFGLFIQRKTRLIFLNPLLISILSVLLILIVFKIDLEAYQMGGDMINLFLGPATVVLAVPLYEQLHNLKHYLVPILFGVVIGSITAMVSTLLCAYMIGLNTEIMASLLPKSITTPIGIAVSESIGGIPAITVLSILVTGIFGTIIAESVFRIFHIDHPIAKGIALGTSAHAVGTSRALAMGRIEGAMSSLAIGISGIITVFLAPMLWQFVLTLL